MLTESLIRARHIEIVGVFLEDAVEMPLVQDQQVVKTLLSN